MNLEDGVSNFELSKRLKEIGVKQESNFWWLPTETARHEVFYDMDIIDDNCDHVAHEHPLKISAFTVAELGEILPIGLYTFRDSTGWYGVDRDLENKEGLNVYIFVDADTEADARAKMLICLIEKGELKP